MNTELASAPINSKIQAQTSAGGDLTLFWYKPNGGIGRFFIALFYLSALAMLVGVFAKPVGQLVSQFSAAGNDFLFIWFLWAAALTCLGAYNFYLLVRSQKPERITLFSDHLQYDTGTSSLFMAMFFRFYGYKRGFLWKLAFQRRRIFSRLEKENIKFIFEKAPSRIHFTIDKKRYYVGIGLPQSDIDWLQAKLGDWSK